MPISKIRFAPGINKEGTQFSAEAGWFDSDKVRFRKGKPEKIGGWMKYSQTSYKGICRSLLDWGTADNTLYLGIGTNLKFYIEQGGTFSDVTPIRTTTTPNTPFAIVGDGDATITVTDTAHGAVLSDFVTFSGAASLGGNITAAVLNQEYKISAIVDDDNYQIEAVDTSGNEVLADSATDTGDGGAGVSAEYQINTGTNIIETYGWGAGPWGGGPWGGGGAIAVEDQLRLYSQDEFADDLLFNPRLGGIYLWDESSGVGTRAVALSDIGGESDAPHLALQVMVSQVDRHVIAFGANPLTDDATIDPLLVRWSDQESAINWTPTATNSAGGQVLSSGTKIVGAIKTRQEILIFTDTSIHAMRFSGAPFVFQFSVVSENVSMISPKAAAEAGDAVFFMSEGGFYVYQGSVRRMECSVHDHVFKNLDRTQDYKVHAAAYPNESEVTWYYPVGTNPAEITNYVTYNYQEDHWTIGTLVRGTWLNALTRPYPISSTIDITNIDTNYLYNQEFGRDADGEEMGEYIESGEVSLNEGESFAFMRRFIPDFRFTGVSANANLTVSIKGSDFSLNTPSVEATSTVTASTKQNHVRVRAREVILRIEGTGLDYGWTMGDWRFDLRTDGRR